MNENIKLFMEMLDHDQALHKSIYEAKTPEEAHEYRQPEEYHLLPSGYVTPKRKTLPEQVLLRNEDGSYRVAEFDIKPKKR